MASKCGRAVIKIFAQEGTRRFSGATTANTLTSLLSLRDTFGVAGDETADKVLIRARRCLALYTSAKIEFKYHEVLPSGATVQTSRELLPQSSTLWGEKLICQPIRAVVKVKWICNLVYHRAVLGGHAAGGDN